ncbi:hypothetical protein SAMN05444401_0931 [Clostridium amylolyticum]|uniref:Uncharacterized protein n=1 Tax=Clostridium amylolyticum TaxID=1121298 RepID=A0A1M6BXI6_9CLOT|nr:DUF5692 family protein [Clostridium amylolyticum]SHI53492.1 hypothetical protein SAMN05444401_0931 [Clostridium amylolyticum]
MGELSLKKGWSLQQTVLWFMFTATVLGTALLTAYNPIWANVPLNVIPAVLVLLFLKPVFFEKLKLSTLIIMRTLIVFAVAELIPGQTYVNVVMVFLAINILEATFTDLKHKQYFNFVTGLVLAVSVIVLKGTWEGGIYSAHGHTVEATICWIIAYTLWNWIFVTGEFSASISLMHVGILLAPIIGVIITINPGLWLLLRANTLTFGGILQISNKRYFEKSFENEKFEKFIQFTHKNIVQLILMMINLALIAYAFIAIYI